MTRRSVAGRRATAGVIGLVVLAALALGGCKQDNTPTEYNTLTNQNFLETCTNYYFDNTNDTLAVTSNTIKADVTAPDQKTCQCMYEIFAGPEGAETPPVPINSSVAKEAQYSGYTGPNFTTLNSDLKADGQKAWDGVPQDIKDQINTCNATQGGSSSTTPTTAAQTTTTTAAP